MKKLKAQLNKQGDGFVITFTDEKGKQSFLSIESEKFKAIFLMVVEMIKVGAINKNEKNI